VHPQQQRGGSGGVGAVREGEPSAQRASVGGLGADLGEAAGKGGRRGRCPKDGHGAAGARPADGELDAHRVRGCEVGGPQRVDLARVGGHLDVGVGVVVLREPGDAVLEEVDEEDRAPSVLVGRHDQSGAVRQPLHPADPAVPGLDDLDALAEGVQTEQVQGHGRCPVRGGQGLAQVGDGAAVGRDDRGPEIGVRVVDQDGAALGVEVEAHEDAAQPALGLREVPRGDDEGAVRAEVVARLAQRAARPGGQVHDGEVLGGVLGRLDPPGDVVPSREVPAEQVRCGRAEVVVPVPDRVALVQDRADLRVLADRAQALVVLGIRRRGQQVRGEDDGSRRAGRLHAGDAAGVDGDHASLAAAGGQDPERGGVGCLLGVLGLRVRARGREQEVAVGGERRAGLALGAAGEPTGRAGARREDLPQRGVRLRAVVVERGDLGDQPRPVG